MADNTGVAAAANADAAQQPQTMWQVLKSIATRIIILYFVMNAVNMFKQKPNTNVSNSDGSVPPIPSELPGNMFPKGSRFVCHINERL